MTWLIHLRNRKNIFIFTEKKMLQYNVPFKLKDFLVTCDNLGSMKKISHYRKKSRGEN